MNPAADPETRVPDEKLRLLFALLFSSPDAVTLDRIREVLYPQQGAGGEQGAGADQGADAEPNSPVGADRQDDADLEAFSPRQHLEALEQWLDEKDLPLQLHQVGRSWRLLTSEEVADELASVQRKVHQDRMGPAALEVLSLVAYRQPVLKADVDAIRGVKSGPHLRHLLDLRLVRILGRADLPGRPFLYGTTREFLDRFGLRDLKDLPEAGRLATPAEAPPASETPQASETPPASDAPAGSEAQAASDAPPTGEEPAASEAPAAAGE